MLSRPPTINSEFFYINIYSYELNLKTFEKLQKYTLDIKLILFSYINLKGF